MKVVVTYGDRPDDTICATANTTLGELRSKINSRCSEGGHFNKMWVVFESNVARYLHFEGTRPGIDMLTLKQVNFGNPDNNEVRVGVMRVFHESADPDQDVGNGSQDTHTLPASKRARC
jgi:hypothetical protein